MTISEALAHNFKMIQTKSQTKQEGPEVALLSLHKIAHHLSQCSQSFIECVVIL